MAAPASRLHYPPALQEALAWLGAPPANDPLHDLAPMRRHLGAIADIGIPPLQYAKILELFDQRAGLLGTEVKPLLLDATLPVPKRLRIVAQGLVQIHRAIGTGCLKVLQSASPEKLRAEYSQARLCSLALEHMLQEFEVGQFVSATPTPDFWSRAESLYRSATSSIDPSEEATGRMKALLAMAAGQPEAFSPREVAFLADYLREHANPVEIRGAGEGSEDDYWLDSMHGLAPTAAIRRRATPGALRFCCGDLGRLARDHVARLEGGQHADSLGLPDAANEPDYRDVLARAAESWASPQLRRTNRRRHGYRVQVCTQLGQLWREIGGADGATAGESMESEWMVLNESANGYAIMHVAGALTGVVAGSAIGLRPVPEKPWSICLVRWARSDNPEHIELGLELVAPQAEAVRVAWRNSVEDAGAVPALLLPALPGLGRGESLLTARGGFRPEAFALIKESSGRIRVAECAAGHLRMHTASIEIFEFERKRIPE